MSHTSCISCGAIVPDTAYCQACGNALKKWCPGCGDWKPAMFQELDAEGDVVYAETMTEAKFCPDCGQPLQVKSAPRN